MWMQHDTQLDGPVYQAMGGLSTGYMHLLQGSATYQFLQDPNTPDLVLENQQIAISNATNYVRVDPHLHFETWLDGFRIDPEPLLSDNLSGFLDPAPISNEGLHFDFRFLVGPLGYSFLRPIGDADPFLILDSGQTLETTLTDSDISSFCNGVENCSITATLRIISPRLGGARELASWEIKVGPTAKLTLYPQQCPSSPALSLTTDPPGIDHCTNGLCSADFPIDYPISIIPSPPPSGLRYLGHLVGVKYRCFDDEGHLTSEQLVLDDGIKTRSLSGNSTCYVYYVFSVPILGFIPICGGGL